LGTLKLDGITDPASIAWPMSTVSNRRLIARVGNSSVE
jgi:hypothetical protein